jgi:hypothetical protein
MKNKAAKTAATDEISSPPSAAPTQNTDSETSSI